MLATRNFYRFRQINKNRFLQDTHIRYNEVYIEGICKKVTVLNNTKKDNTEELKQWIDSLENYIQYWVAKFHLKRNY